MEKRKPFWFLTDYQEGTGNIWGWKFSIFGGIFIALLLGLAVYRSITLDVPFTFDPEAEKELIHPFLQRNSEDTTTTNQDKNEADSILQVPGSRE
ncbi:MAG: hypothetical protein AAF242_09510 [Bacteroidota bacterium]